MPPTMEAICTDESCELDMVELHFTYDMPGDVSIADFQCPYCGTSEALEEITL